MARISSQPPTVFRKTMIGWTLFLRSKGKTAGVMLMGSKSVQKGARAEREVMSLLRECGYPVERGGTQSFGQRPDLYGLDHVHLEVKRAECARIWEWMRQSQEDAARFGDGWPTVIFRRSRSDWMVCMTLSDWLQLYGRAHNCKCGGACSAAETGEKAQK